MVEINSQMLQKKKRKEINSQESETYSDLFLKKLDVLYSFVENRSRIRL